MGRKSTKAKDKKARRKEENAKLLASQAVVDAANMQEDPMAALAAFKKFDRNGLNLSIECKRVKDLDAGTVEWAFQLTKTNMQTLYEESEWGWSDKQKREEMTEDEAWYLIARNTDSNDPQAMVHFRFDLDDDVEVLYCYEVQLCKEARRKGLGKFLMQILELLAHRNHLKKVMLTAFKHNHDAQEFFVKKLKYEVDETTPTESVVETFFDEEGYTYEILSKKIVPRTKPVVVTQPQKSTLHQQNGQVNAAEANLS